MAKSESAFTLCVILFLVLTAPAGCWEKLDGVAAIVDDRIILISELQSQIQLAAMQFSLDISDSARIDSLRKTLLQQMIDDKLVLIEAEKDTTIKITGKQIEEALNQQIERLKSQFPSEDAFMRQLTAEGLTLKSLRLRYREQIKNQLTKEMYLDKLFSKITISSGETKEFYNTYRDSLPRLPAGYHLAQILLGIYPNETVQDSLRRFAEALRQKIAAGEDFTLMARSFSDDASSEEGGELGWFGRGEMVPEFDSAAFSLGPGELSGVVRTRFGFHIIKCLEKKEDKIRVSHILIGFKPSPEDILGKRNFADSLRDLLTSGADFGDLASKYSEDEGSRFSDGDIGWFSLPEMLPEFREVVDKLNPGDISPPIKTDYGWHIVKVLEKQDGRPVDYVKDYTDIEKLARRYKTQKELQQWLKTAREKYYVQIVQ